jgi:osmotically-inducible protein OsmY
MTLSIRRIALSAVIAGNLVGLSACVPLVPLMVGGGVVVGTMVAIDRRTSGTQLEDEGIDIRASSRIREALGDRVQVNVTSYNRQVLLTGEVPNVQDKQLVEQIVSRVDNVRNVVNELAVMGKSTLTQRSSDTLVTGRVKAALVDAKDLAANAFKVITERGTTYMMGRVTQREADRATEVIRAVSGVQKVVRLLEIISEDELARILPQAPPSPKN